MFSFHLLFTLYNVNNFSIEWKFLNLTAYYCPSIDLSADYECSPIDFQSYNSIPNIDYDNNLLHTGDKVIEIPVGFYELQDIVNYLTEVYKSYNNNKSIEIVANNNTLQIEVIYTHDTILFNRELFGFDKVLEPSINYVSNLPVNILKANALQVQCNIITGAYINKIPAHTLHEFALDVPPRYKLDVIPRNCIYLPVNAKEISCLTIWIVDENGRLINFRGGEITLRLHLKPNLK